MSDFGATYALSRQRFSDSVKDLNADQLNWRLHPGMMTIGEMALHLAGVEISFASQLTGASLDEATERIRRASTDGSVNDNPFPFEVSEITPELVEHALATGRSMAEPLLTNPSDEIRATQIKSALGPIIDGTGAFARLSFHPGYHHGQVHAIRTAPGFPS